MEIGDSVRWLLLLRRESEAAKTTMGGTYKYEWNLLGAFVEIHYPNQNQSPNPSPSRYPRLKPHDSMASTFSRGGFLVHDIGYAIKLVLTIRLNSILHLPRTLKKRNIDNV